MLPSLSERTLGERGDVPAMCLCVVITENERMEERKMGGRRAAKPDELYTKNRCWIVVGNLGSYPGRGSIYA